MKWEKSFDPEEEGYYLGIPVFAPTITHEYYWGKNETTKRYQWWVSEGDYEKQTIYGGFCLDYDPEEIILAWSPMPKPYEGSE